MLLPSLPLQIWTITVSNVCYSSRLLVCLQHPDKLYQLRIGARYEYLSKKTKHERLKPCEMAEVALWLREAVGSCSRSVVDEERLYSPSFWSYHMCANINSLATVVASGLITYYQCYLFPKGAVRELSLALHLCKTRLPLICHTLSAKCEHFC